MLGNQEYPTSVLVSDWWDILARFSPNADKLLLRTGSRLVLIEVETGQTFWSQAVDFRVDAFDFTADQEGILLVGTTVWNAPSFLQLRSAATGEVVRSLTSSQRDFLGVVAHPTQAYAFVGRENGSWIGIWDYTTGEWRGRLSKYAPLSVLNFASNKHLAVADGQELYLLNVADGNLSFRLLAPSIITGGRLSPDGRLFALATADEVVVYRLPDWSLLWRLPGSVSSLDFSPDGRYLATNHQVWRLSDGAAVHNLPEGVDSVAFTRDGRWMLAGYSYTLVEDPDGNHWWDTFGHFQRWAVDSWQMVAEELASGGVVALAALPRNRMLFGIDQSDGWIEGVNWRGALELRDALTSTLHTREPVGVPESVVASRTGRYAAALSGSGGRCCGNPDYARDFTLTLWRLLGDTVSVSYVYPDYRYDMVVGESRSAIVLSPDEQWIAFSSGTLVVVRNPLYTPYGDVDNDGCVDDGDLLAVLFAFGSTDATADVDGNGIVDDSDLLTVLFNFGSGC